MTLFTATAFQGGKFCLLRVFEHKFTLA